MTPINLVSFHQRIPTSNTAECPPNRRHLQETTEGRGQIEVILCVGAAVLLSWYV